MTTNPLCIRVNTARLIGISVLIFGSIAQMTTEANAQLHGSASEMTISTSVSGDSPIKLNGPLIAGGNTSTERISPDNSTVVFRADAEIDGVIELYSVPIGGGTVTKLNPNLSGSRDVNNFAITSDSSTVIFHADVDTTGVDELYSVPIGGGTVTKLSPNTLTTTREVLFTRLISADSSTVVYIGDQNTNNVNELFSVPIGGGTVTRLNDPLPPGGGTGLFGFELTPDGSRLIYSADQETNNVHEIFSVPIGGGTVTKLNSTLATGGILGGAVFEFQISPDGSTVVYRGRQDTASINEIYAVPVGGGTPIK